MLTSRPSARRSDGLADKLFSVDWAVVGSALALAAFGLVIVFSATKGPGWDISTAARQVFFVAVGSLAMAVLGLVDYRGAKNFAVVIFVACLAMLVAVLTPLGTEVKATKGWFQVAGFSLQPAEFVKLGLIVTLAAVFSGRSSLTALGRTLAALVVAGTITVLVLAQGEVGSVLVYAAITLGIMVTAGVPRRHLAVLVVAGLLGIAGIMASGTLKEYQQQRLTSFLDLDADVRGAGYNQRQSITAVGSGGLLGKGLFDGPQTQLQFVPEQETDFIFTVVAEELGFAGSVTLLALYSVLLFRLFRLAQLARDDFGSLLCVGVLVMLLFQLFQNVGMNVGIMPITGIPLPFISYGGSSLLTTMMAIGLVVSVSVHRYRGTPA